MGTKRFHLLNRFSSTRTFYNNKRTAVVGIDEINDIMMIGCLPVAVGLGQLGPFLALSAGALSWVEFPLVPPWAPPRHLPPKVALFHERLPKLRFAEDAGLVVVVEVR